MQDQNYYAPFDCVIACDHDSATLSMINTAARFAARPFYAGGIHGFYGYIFADLVVHEYIIEREKSNMPNTNPRLETLTRSILNVTNRKESSGKQTEIVKKQEIYCPLILANTAPLSPDILSSRRKLKSVPALLPCLRALFDFQTAFGRSPNHTGADIATFTTLVKQKSSELQLPAETLQPSFLRSFLQNLSAELPPTAAFVGGRLSEDVINVLGKREQPIQNFALFDGDALSGRIFSLYTAPPELAVPGSMGILDPAIAAAVAGASPEELERMAKGEFPIPNAAAAVVGQQQQQ
jgi:ubiquitin-like 1-activating enzyme E1 A